MKASDLRLRPLTVEDEPIALLAHTELAAEKFSFLLGQAETPEPWSRYIARLAALSRGENVPAGLVPATFLVADVGGVIVGRTSLRHELNEYLATWGGHIGYAVRPAYRRRGYGTAILRATLKLAERHAISPALIVCDETNLASAAVIERCGGELESVIPGHDGGPAQRRYWVPTEK
jgi:predicted acetyltransferase